MLSRRQINVQRENLAAMCRISVKSLLDYACLYTQVDEDCEEFINFCAVFEQLVSHRLRPYQKKVWLPGQGSPRHFWDVLMENYNRTRGFLFPCCIPNIDAIETFKSPKAKLRAFIRVALMEKRLSDYMFWLLDNTTLICESYLDGALLASEEAAVLCGDFIGLNAIDFNFCLKGNENELLGPLEISYSQFLKYKQILASRYSDDLEMLQLSAKETEEDIHPGNMLSEGNINDMLRLQSLEKNISHIKEQKDYLEELLRLRDRQIKEANIKIENMKVEKKLTERAWEKECRTMDACVLELQAELGKFRRQNESLKAQVASLKQFKQRMEIMEVPLVDMAMGEDREGDKSEPLVDVAHAGDKHAVPMTAIKRKPPTIASDQRSIISLLSDNTNFFEDSQSMAPLTGSLADVSLSQLSYEGKEHQRDVAFPKIQITCSSETTAFKRDVNENPEDQSRQEDQTMYTSPDREALCESHTVGVENEYIVISHTSLENDEVNQNSEVYSSLACLKGIKEIQRNSSEANTTMAQDENQNRISEEYVPDVCVKIYKGNEISSEVDMTVANEESQKEVEFAVSESYVVMEEGVTKDSFDHLKAQNLPGNSDEITVEMTTIGSDSSEPTSDVKDSAEFTVEQQDAVVASENSSTESDKEEEGVMSDPEMVNPSNPSSDSGDATWEILSDSEQAENHGEN